MLTLKWCNRLVIAATMLAAIALHREYLPTAVAFSCKPREQTSSSGTITKTAAARRWEFAQFTSLMPSTLAWDSPSFISFTTPPAGTQGASLVD